MRHEVGNKKRGGGERTEYLIFVCNFNYCYFNSKQAKSDLLSSVHKTQLIHN